MNKELQTILQKQQEAMTRNNNWYYEQGFKDGYNKGREDYEKQLIKEAEKDEAKLSELTEKQLEKLLKVKKVIIGQSL